LFSFQHVLVRDGNGDLSLYLHQLILHIEDDLFDHFFRIFRLIDEVVQVRPY
jgi:hypothetical protein